MIITESERSYLLDSMHSLLGEYGYKYTDNALNKIINVWAREKSVLISAFKKHPNYLDGKFMIAFDQDYERSINPDGARRFWIWLAENAVAHLKDHIPEELIVQRNMEYCTFLPEDLYNFLCNMHHIAFRTIDDETANRINHMLPNIHAHNGEKTSRVINRICSYLGYDKAYGYNREFAKFADSLSPMTITRHTVLSINPLDYLTMSFGNSWSSCHTIDKTNKRGMPSSYSGCYSSGTMSYMLDGTSMVFYTVDASYDESEYWTQPKISRQMFHYGEDKLVQGRLYPQDNDGYSMLYTNNRNIVQEIVANIFDFPNLWTLKTGTEAAGDAVESKGTHYRDYSIYPNCTLSIKKKSSNDNQLIVGACPICVQCGRNHSDETNINCCPLTVTCSCCGTEIEIGEATEWDEEYYCASCTSYCSCCGDRAPKRVLTYVESEDRHVCSDCLDGYYYVCEQCGQYVYHTDVTFVDCDNAHICHECLNNESEAS